MITINELIVDSWPAARTSHWVAIVDLGLFLVLGFWALIDLAANPIVYVARHHDSTRPEAAPGDTPRAAPKRAVSLLEAIRVV